MRSNFIASSVGMLAIACLFTAAGCRSATVPDSVLPLHGGNDPQVQLDYWHELATKRLVSNDEAFHGLLLYLDETDNAGSYPQRVAALKSRGLLARGFNRPSDEALERGTLAVAVARMLNIKGGVTMRLLGGTNPRYAMRELEYRDIFPPSSTNQIFTGSEFVGVIGKV